MSNRSATIVKTNPHSAEDKLLRNNFTSVCELYWYFNVFTQIVETFDTLIHIFITIDSLFFHYNFRIFLFSLTFNIISRIIEIYYFGYPFYWFINNCQSKYLIESHFRLIQLWYRYHDIVNKFFSKRARSTNSTKNFGYLSIKTLSKVYIEDHGAHRFALHQYIESIPQSILYFILIITCNCNQLLYTSSIILSILSISCQLFNFFAASNNIHYSILFNRFICIVIDIFGSFTILSCLLYCYYDDNINISNNWILYIFYIKFLLITLPLSLTLSTLFILRAVAPEYNPNNPPHTILLLLQVVCLIILIVIITLLSSILFELFLNFYWISYIIQRLCNQRFSYFDGNTNFWRRIIEWLLLDFKDIVKTKHSTEIQNELITSCRTTDKVLRLFSVNANVCMNIYRFNDDVLMKWMDNIYQKAYYTHDIDIKTNDFNKNSKLKVGYRVIYKMIINEQIGTYFDSNNANIVNDIVIYMRDVTNTVLFGFLLNIINVNSIEIGCRYIFNAILYFSLWIITPLYFYSKLFNVLFPLIMILTVSINNWLSFTFIICVFYYLTIIIFLILWFVNIKIGGYTITCGHDVSILISSICPSLLKSGEVYVSLRHGYFTQHELFSRIQWHYNQHRYAKIKGKIVIEAFGKDIAREIFDFLPRSYGEEKLTSTVNK